MFISELNNGGSSYQAINLAKQLQKRGHNIKIFTLKNNIKNINLAILSGLSIKSAEFNLKLRNNNQFLGFLSYFLEISQRVLIFKKFIDEEKEKIDIINCHDWPTNIAAALLKITRGIPNLFICNDIWFIPGNEPSKEKRIIFRLGNKYLISVIDKLLSLWINRIIVLDHRIQTIVQSHYHKNAIIIRSGLDVDFFLHHTSKQSAKKKMNLTHNCFIFLCIAIFLPHRRFEDAILAFKELVKDNPNAMLYIIGSDYYDKQYAQKIRDIIEKERLSSNVLVKLEYITEEEKRFLFSSADVFIFPNEKQTWGITVTEAMATGLACIVSKEAGVHEIIKDEITGLLYSPRNIKELSEKMELLLHNDQLRYLIGINGQEYIKKHLSWEKFSFAIENEMLKLI